jgi:hypothetical protein
VSLKRRQVFKQLTRLSAREQFVQFCRRDGLKANIHVPVSRPAGFRVLVSVCLFTACILRIAAWMAESVKGLATGFAIRGSNPGEGEVFPCGPARGPTQPPVQRTPVLSRG